MFLDLHSEICFWFQILISKIEKPCYTSNCKGFDRLCKFVISLSLPFAQTIFGTNREKALELRAFFIDFAIPETLDITGFSGLPSQIRPKTGFSVFVMTYTL